MAFDLNPPYTNNLTKTIYINFCCAVLGYEMTWFGDIIALQCLPQVFTPTPIFHHVQTNGCLLCAIKVSQISNHDISWFWEPRLISFSFCQNAVLCWFMSQTLNPTKK